MIGFPLVTSFKNPSDWKLRKYWQISLVVASLESVDNWNLCEGVPFES